MAYITLPQPERTKSGLEAFTEGASPYLQQAFAMMMQRKMGDYERQKQMETQEMQRQQAYGEAERMGFLQRDTDYQRAMQETPGFQLDVSPQVTSKWKPDEWKRLYQKMTGKTMPEEKYTSYRPTKKEGYKTSLKFGAGGIPEFGMETEDEISQAYKQSQLELNKTIIDAYKKGEAGSRIFRDLRTGEEVDETTALQGMQQGKQYNVFLRTPTRTGAKEQKIAEPQKLSEDQVSFVSAYKERKKDLEDLIERLTPQTKAPMGGFARISARQRLLVPEKELRALQEPYTRVIQTFLFGPAGKALTGTEREVLERAAEATGKTPEEWERDLMSAYNILNDKYDYLATGNLPQGFGTGQPTQQQPQEQENFSNISTEELLRRRQQLLQGGGQ